MPKSSRKRKYSLNRARKYAKSAKRVWKVANQLGSVIARTRTGPATGRSPALHASMARRGSTSSLSSARSSNSATYLERRLVSTGDGMTNSTFTHNYKPMKGWTTAKKLSKSDVYKRGFNNSYLSEYGSQGVNTASFTMLSGDIVNTFSFSQQTNATQNLLGATSAGDANRILWLDSVEEEMIFNNHSPGCAFFTIYDLLCKEDKSPHPETAWYNGIIQAAGLYDQNNFAQSTSQGSAKVNVYWPSKPQDSPMFKRSWKILQKTNIELHTGRAHRHVRKLNYKGRLPYEKAVNSTEAVPFRGVTHCVMIVQHGMPTSNIPAHEKDNVVTIDQTKINMIGSQTITSRVTTVKGKHLQYSYDWNEAPSAAYQQQADAAGIFNSQANTVNITTAFS